MSLRVCYFGTYRENYSRNRIMIEGLRRNGVDVQICHRRLWKGIEDRVRVASGSFWHPSFILRLVRVYWQLFGDYLHLDPFDVLVVGYPGHLDVWLARILSWFSRKPLVMDVFMSPYLVATERGITRRHRWASRLLYAFEWLVYRLPDRLLQDTEAYVAWFQKNFGVRPSRFRLVPTGADDRAFRRCNESASSRLYRVVYYGTFIPNHGVSHIVDAARRLRDEPDIVFELIGEGPDRKEAEATVSRFGLQNVIFVRWLDQSDLVDRLCEADVCLGAFGVTPQSLMTIQNKIFEALALGLPVVTGDSPTIREAFDHRRHLYLVGRASGTAIASAIRELRSDPHLADLIAEAGHARFQECYTLAALGRRYTEHLSEFVPAGGEGR